MNTTFLTAPDTDISEIQRIFSLQKEHQHEVARSTAKQRIAKLKKLLHSMNAHKQEIRDALYQDFHKPRVETDLSETFYVNTEIKHAIQHLKKWMRPKRVKTPLALMGSRSYVHPEPKGLVLLVSPWNYPFNLTFGPLVGAIAAGNCVMIKPAEYTPASSAVMSKIVKEVFDEREIAVVEGGIEVGKACLDLPFNHIFFTGSPQVGKIVMEAAAKNLASVTLELGGKSPVIVDETARLDDAVPRIAWAKFSNNGQICIAPDYIYVHESKVDAFIEKFKAKVKEYYGDDEAAQKASESYCRLVNTKHFDRVSGMVIDAVEKGAKVEMGGQHDREENFLAPTILSEVPADADVLNEEIFGPIAPIVPYSDINEPLSFINGREKPLALYIYSRNQKNIRKVINSTRAGTTCVNDSAVHYFNTNMPFGGSNNSGIGKSHGEYSFKEFTNERAVFVQMPFFTAMSMMLPPYNKKKEKLVDMTMKYL